MKGAISGTTIVRLAGCLPLLLTLSVGVVNITFDGEQLDRPCQPESDCAISGARSKILSTSSGKRS